jgi:hypothetical protein
MAMPESLRVFRSIFRDGRIPEKAGGRSRPNSSGCSRRALQKTVFVKALQDDEKELVGNWRIQVDGGLLDKMVV